MYIINAVWILMVTFSPDNKLSPLNSGANVMLHFKVQIFKQ